jgi:hypothetical protein
LIAGGPASPRALRVIPATVCPNLPPSLGGLWRTCRSCGVAHGDAGWSWSRKGPPIVAVGFNPRSVAHRFHRVA